MNSEIDDDFQPVRHSGGTITFKFIDQDGQRAYSVGLSNSSAHPCALFALYALLPQGIPAGVVPFGGLGSPTPDPPVPNCLLVIVASDQEGFFGRNCPRCRGYFRTNAAGQQTRCPYCRLTTGTHSFLSESQRKYVAAYAELFLDGFESGRDVTIDIDELGQREGVNAPPSSFAEEKQQTRFRCKQCPTSADIIGRHGYCPSCGRRNSYDVLSLTLDALDERVSNPRYSQQERDLRDAEWRTIVRDCVSSFEGFGRDLLQELARIPASPARRKVIEGITFHNPLAAARVIAECFAIDLLKGLGQEDQEFLRKRFMRRHVYEHCSGIADQEYLANSGDTSVRAGQLIREKSNNVATLIRLVRAFAANFDEGFHSIK